MQLFIDGYDFFTSDWEIDNVLMEKYLSEMIIVSGTARNNLCKVSKRIGGSALYGHTWKTYLSPTRNKTPSKVFKNMAQTKLVDDHPEMAAVFKEFASIYFPDFEYTQITINKNFPVGRHKDSTNTGISYLCAFGTYTGGKTGVNFRCNDCIDSTCLLDPRKKPVSFDGSKYEHWVEPFEGTRYSLVFYNNIKNYKDKLINQEVL
jgi:hypothetical protein